MNETTGNAQSEPTRAIAWPDAKKPWHVLLEGDRQEGPLSLSALREQIQNGRIRPDTYVWQPGMGDWELAGEVPQLALLWEDLRLLPALQPTPPPPVEERDSAAAVTDPRFFREPERRHASPLLDPFAIPAPPTREGADFEVPMDLGTYLFADLSNPHLPVPQAEEPKTEISPFFAQPAKEERTIVVPTIAFSDSGGVSAPSHYLRRRSAVRVWHVAVGAALPLVAVLAFWLLLHH